VRNFLAVFCAVVSISPAVAFCAGPRDPILYESSYLRSVFDDPLGADVAVGYDTSMSSTTDSVTSSSNTINVADNPQRILVAWSSTAGTGKVMRCNGVPMTKYSTSDFYYTIAPPVGSNTIGITTTGAASRRVCVYSLYGADQSSPLSTYQTGLSGCGMGYKDYSPSWLTHPKDGLVVWGYWISESWATNASYQMSAPFTGYLGTIGFYLATGSSTVSFWSVGTCNLHSVTVNGVVIED